MFGSRVRIAAPIFQEQQRFTQWWIWLLAFATGAAVLIIFGWAMYRQLIQGQPFGDNPMSDEALMIMGPIFILLFGMGLPWLLLNVRMTTELDSTQLLVRYRPFYAKCIRLKDIASARARTYRPLLEYGGWGIKLGPSGWVYNVSGNRGVQLVLRGGKRILVGSQKPEQLETAFRGVGVSGESVS